VPRTEGFLALAPGRIVSVSAAIQANDDESGATLQGAGLDQGKLRTDKHMLTGRRAGYLKGAQGAVVGQKAFGGIHQASAGHGGATKLTGPTALGADMKSGRFVLRRPAPRRPMAAIKRPASGPVYARERRAPHHIDSNCGPANERRSRRTRLCRNEGCTSITATQPRLSQTKLDAGR